ncbi:MAG: right-handed parallel beta-helix repeat-containing protein [Candidatus Hermodarchaeota archaeon]
MKLKTAIIISFLFTSLGLIVVQTIEQNSSVSFTGISGTEISDIQMKDEDLSLSLLKTPKGLTALLKTDYSPLYLDLKNLQKRIYELQGEPLVHLRIQHSAVTIEKTDINIPISLEDCTGSIISSSNILINNTAGANVSNSTIENILWSNFTYGISLINSPNSVIYNNTIRNIESTGASAAGIHVVNSGGTTIEKNTIEDISSMASGFLNTNDVYGIIINASENVKVLGNNITNLCGNAKAYGIWVGASSNIQINDTIIDDITSKSSYGVYVNNSGNARIKNNTVTNLSSSALASYGFLVKSSSNSWVILNNVTALSSTSFASGIYLQECNNPVIGNNSLESISTISAFFSLCGIGLEDSTSPLLEWNSISSFSSLFTEVKGIYIKEADGAVIGNNTLTNLSSDQKSAYGITLRSSHNAAVNGNVLTQISSLSDQGIVTNSVSAFGIYLLESNDTSINWNSMTSTTFWVYADDYTQSSNTHYSNNIVDGNAVSLLNFTRPVDVTYDEGDTGNSISWTATDSKADTYTIYKDGIKVANGTWESNQVIAHSVDNLMLGVYVYRIDLTDLNGQNTTDEVIVNVFEDDLPILIGPPEDIRYLVGTAEDYVISWTVEDKYPATYSIYRNGTELDFGAWSSLVPINISVRGLSLGVYNYTLVAKDMSDNVVNDTVMVFVLNETYIALKSQMPQSFEYEYGSSGNILNWTIESATGGTYMIFQDGESITTGAFLPGVPIIHPINNLEVGSYNFSITAVDDFDNTVHGFVIVTVTANPTFTVPVWNSSTAPPYSEPPYLTIPPEFPWPVVFGLTVIAALIVGSILVTQRLMVPEVVKKELRALKMAKALKDKTRIGEQLSRIAQVYQEIGETGKAIKYQQKALTVFRRIEDKAAQQRALGNLGDAYFQNGGDYNE